MKSVQVICFVRKKLALSLSVQYFILADDVASLPPPTLTTQNTFFWLCLQHEETVVWLHAFWFTLCADLEPLLHPTHLTSDVGTFACCPFYTDNIIHNIFFTTMRLLCGYSFEQISFGSMLSSMRYVAIKRTLDLISCFVTHAIIHCLWLELG